MMLRRYSGLVLVAIISAAVTYLASYGMQRSDRPSGEPGAGRGRGPSISRWLGLTPEQTNDIRQIEASFAADRRPLEAKLAAERERLAALLEDSETANDEILQQVENVIAAQNALERRVADLLVALRPHLTAEQQKRLFARFASGVREGCGRQWRHGQHDDFERGPHGDGPPPGRGFGRGHGRGGGHQWRGGPHEHSTTAPASQPTGVQP